MGAAVAELEAAMRQLEANEITQFFSASRSNVRESAVSLDISLAACEGEVSNEVGDVTTHRRLVYRRRCVVTSCSPISAHLSRRGASQDC
jgi:hypothetical protein